MIHCLGREKTGSGRCGGGLSFTPLQAWWMPDCDLGAFPDKSLVVRVQKTIYCTPKRAGTRELTPGSFADEAGETFGAHHGARYEHRGRQRVDTRGIASEWRARRRGWLNDGLALEEFLATQDRLCRHSLESALIVGCTSRLFRRLPIT
jgi:hypothetical protein